MIIFAFYLQSIFGLSSAYPPLKCVAEESERKVLIFIKEYDIVQTPQLPHILPNRGQSTS